MGTDLTWLGETGLDTETGLSYTGGEDKYISALQRFYKNYEKNRARVIEYLEAGDYENYMITVHALKSNAKMIGARDLSTLFETLESAARNNETELIEAQNAVALNAYDDLIQKLAPVSDMGDVRAADEISGEEARQTADKLLAALDDFDDEEAKRLAKILSGYPFRMTQADKLKEAVSFIEDFMYDEAADIIRQIVPTIE
ncbi:MAG: Hpt domain-containing protein [Lachnospiraceae bacterium]|nr:Hpt domain-containing protein [Lachnospiraceae bacterium]